MSKQNSYDEDFYHSQMQVSYESAKEVIKHLRSAGGGVCRYKKRY